jgi:Gas vesicle synthesis protein GvpO
MPAREAAEMGLRQVADLTGREPQGVVSLEPAEDGWVVGVEVLEDRRIPSTADILALYEAEIDEVGDLIAYSRKRRYPRGKTDSGEVAR